MVRAAEVPGRVVLGYTPGQDQADEVRLVTTDDAHAWVEVCPSPSTWAGLPFDPTPISSGSGRSALPWAPRVGEGRPRPRTAARRRRRRRPHPRRALTAGPRHPDVQRRRARPAGCGHSGRGGRRRPHRRRRRRARERPRAAPPSAGRRRSAHRLWDELTATVQDLGLSWDPAWTPRQAATHLTEQAGHGADPVLADRAEESIRRLAWPRSRDLRPGRAGTRAVRAAALETGHGPGGLIAAVPHRTRLRARCWPASLVSEVAASHAGAAASLRQVDPPSAALPPV